MAPGISDGDTRYTDEFMGPTGVSSVPPNIDDCSRGIYTLRLDIVMNSFSKSLAVFSFARPFFAFFMKPGFTPTLSYFMP